MLSITMPYARRTYKKYPAKRYSKKGTSTAKLARDVKKIKKSLDGELKVQDTGTAYAVSNSPQWTLLNGLIRGDDYNNRQGRSVKWSSFYMRYTIVCNAGSVNYRFVRIVLLWAKDPDGVQPTALQYFGTALPLINQMPNLNLRRDFTVLSDKIIDVSGYSLPTDESAQHFSIRKKCTQTTIFNAGNTGSISDIESGAFYLLTFSDTATVGEQPVFTFQSRMRYVDN